MARFSQRTRQGGLGAAADPNETDDRQYQRPTESPQRASAGVRVLTAQHVHTLSKTEGRGHDVGCSSARDGVLNQWSNSPSRNRHLSNLATVSNRRRAYVILRAESHDEAAARFAGHPHFAVFPGDAVEVMECLPIPGA